MHNSAQTHVSIGTLAKKTGVNIETIRYYEREGILAQPLRTAGGHRLYRENDIKRLFFVRRCRELGFSIKEIRSLFSLVDVGDYTCGEIHEITLRHADAINEKIIDLQKMAGVLAEMAAKCSQGETPDCPIIDTLFRLE